MGMVPTTGHTWSLHVEGQRQAGDECRHSQGSLARGGGVNSGPVTWGPETSERLGGEGRRP